MAEKASKKENRRSGKGRLSAQAASRSESKAGTRQPRTLKRPAQKPKKKSTPEKTLRKKTVPENRTAKRRPGTRTSPKPPVFVDSCELPIRYDRTGLTLIARDPQSVYAYWEIAPTTLQEAQSKLGPAFKKAIRTIRIFDVTGIDFNGANALNQFDVDVDSRVQSRYIILPNDNATLCADLGFRTRTGAFYQIARSNCISTPSANVSDRSEITWAKVKHKQGSKPLVIAQSCAPVSENRPGETFGKESTCGHEHRPEDAPVGEMANTDLMEPGQATDITRIGWPGKPGQAMVTEKAGWPEYTPVGDMAGAAWPEERPSAGSGRDAARREEAAAMAFLKADATSPVFAEEKTWFSADSASVSSDVLGGASERVRPRKDFFFHVNAELVVYGRTEPGAHVTMDGRDVDLREDGTFSLRLAFPDGVQSLDFCARSAAGSEHKALSLWLGKTTFVKP